MTIRDILVEVDRDAHNPARLTLAVKLAERHAAHLIGLFAYAGLSGTYPHAQGRIALEMLRRHEETPHEAAGRLRAEFEHRADGAGLSHEWRMQEEEGAHSILATQARYADVVVVSQGTPGSPASGHSHGLAGDVIVASGTPTIVVPYAGTFDKTVDKVMIAWNGSREGSRAVRDALPILRAVDEVIVFSVNPDHDHLPGAEIASHLARHGVRMDVRHTVASDIEVGDAILNAVSDHAVDLLVMGAYGHTRLREFVFGGATRHVLRHMTAPTLLTH